MEERSLLVDGKNIQLFEGGSGPPLLYLHGAGVFWWMPVHDLLAPSFHLYLPVHPGFGKSEGMEDIEVIEDVVFHDIALLDTLGLAKVSIVGLSLAMLSDDVFYDNVPFPDIIGRDGVRQFHIDFGFGKDWRAEFRVVNIAAAGNVVLSERVDVFFHTSGGAITLPVMGTVTIEDGMITVWRDYFDPTDFNKQLSQIKR